MYRDAVDPRALTVNTAGQMSKQKHADAEAPLHTESDGECFGARLSNRVRKASIDLFWCVEDCGNTA